MQFNVYIKTSQPPFAKMEILGIPVKYAICNLFVENLM